MGNFEISGRLSDLKAVLESEKIVTYSAATDSKSASINGFTYKDISRCCSLTSRSSFIRYAWRLSLLFTTGKWLNDVKIGQTLIYHCLWVNSSLVNDVKNNDFSQKAIRIAHIELLQRIFRQIILPSYQHVDNREACKAANPVLAQMFSMIDSKKEDQGLIKLPNRVVFLDQLKNIYLSEDPSQALTNTFIYSGRLTVTYGLPRKSKELNKYLKGEISSIQCTTLLSKIPHFLWQDFKLLKYVDCIKRKRADDYDEEILAQEDQDGNAWFQDETIKKQTIVKRATAEWEQKDLIEKIEEMDNYSIIILKQKDSQLYLSSSKNFNGQKTKRAI